MSCYSFVRIGHSFLPRYFTNFIVISNWRWFMEVLYFRAKRSVLVSCYLLVISSIRGVVLIFLAFSSLFFIYFILILFYSVVCLLFLDNDFSYTFFLSLINYSSNLFWYMFFISYFQNSLIFLSLVLYYIYLFSSNKYWHPYHLLFLTPLYLFRL